MDCYLRKESRNRRDERLWRFRSPGLCIWSKNMLYEVHRLETREKIPLSDMVTCFTDVERFAIDHGRLGSGPFDCGACLDHAGRAWNNLFG